MFIYHIWSNSFIHISGEVYEALKSRARLKSIFLKCPMLTLRKLAVDGDFCVYNTILSCLDGSQLRARMQGKRPTYGSSIQKTYNGGQLV